MKYKAFIYSLLIAWSLCLPAKAQTTLLPVCQKALNDKTSIQYVDFKNYPSLLRDLPIGVFDSGTGGFTVLERILRQDRFNNETGEEKPDGIPDFKTRTSSIWPTRQICLMGATTVRARPTTCASWL